MLIFCCSFLFFVTHVIEILQGKKQEFRIESLAALEKIIGSVLSILGLMPASYSEVETD